MARLLGGSNDHEVECWPRRSEQVMFPTFCSRTLSKAARSRAAFQATTAAEAWPTSVSIDGPRRFRRSCTMRPAGSAGMPPPLPVTPPAQNAVTAYDQAVPETQKRIRNARSSAIALGQSRGDQGRCR
jgi:hypothetical protein